MAFSCAVVVGVVTKVSREAGVDHCGAATGGVVTKMSTGAGAAAAACGGHGAFRRGIRADEVLRRGTRRNQEVKAPPDHVDDWALEEKL